MITFPVYNKGTGLPTLHFVDQMTMNIIQKIPNALCFVDWTDSHNPFCGTVEVSTFKSIILSSFTEFTWLEYRELSYLRGIEVKPGDAVVENEVKKLKLIGDSSIISTYKHGDNVLMIKHGCSGSALTYRFGGKCS